jgi:peroxiredoxin
MRVFLQGDKAMFRVAGTLLVVVLLVPGSPVQGGKFNKKIEIGGPAPSYTGLPGTDGKPHSLSDFRDKDVVVVVITCNQCPIAQAYEKRLIDFTKKYAGPSGKVALVAINVSNEEADSLPHMIERAKDKGFNFPYLYDESQKIGRALGATVTPEFFVLNKERMVVYMGGMDDGVNPANVTTNYLAPAVEAALKGAMPAVAETAARGCNVVYQRSAKQSGE